MIDKILEKLDEKVFTPELKESLGAEFNEAVKIKAAQMIDEQVEEKVDALSEKSEQHITLLTEKAEEYTGLVKEEMLDSLDKYMERVIEEFLGESKAALDKSLKSEKADMIIEAFETMLVAGGVDVARISEAKDESSLENKLQESTEKYDTLVEDNITLADENKTLIKMGVIAEIKEGLSLVEAEKFEKLANLVEFTKDAAFAEKLETIKESVKGAAGKDEKKPEDADQNKDQGEKPVWAHLV